MFGDRKVLLTCLVALASPYLSDSVSAQGIDCSVVLRSNLIDTRSSTVGVDILSSIQQDVCSRDFASASAASSHAESGGANLGVFDLFDFSIRGGKSRNNTDYRVQDSEFCSKSARELAASKNINFEERLGRFALQAFQECVKTTTASGLWMTYEIIENGEVLRAQLTRRAAPNTPLGYEISELSVKTTGGAKVDCNVNSDSLPHKAFQAKAINAGTSTFTCTKEGGGAAIIDLRTTISDFSLYMPSQEVAKETEVSELEDRLVLTNLEIDRLSNELAMIPKTETGFLVCEPSQQPLGNSWEYRQSWTIKFRSGFSSPPHVSAAMAQIESYSSSANDAWAVDVGNVTPEGATISFRGAYVDSSLSNCKVSWIAVGR